MSIDNVQDITPREQYTLTAAQTVIPYPFPIFDEADIVLDIDGTIKTITTHYTVSGVGDDNGGNVTLVTPATGGEVATVYRSTAIERTSDLQQNGPIRSSTYNDDQDRLHLILQELRLDARRSIRVAENDLVDFDDMELPTVAIRANRYAVFDSQGRISTSAGTGSDSGLRDDIANGNTSAVFVEPNIAAMTGLDSPSDGACCLTLGYSAEGDGGHGEYYYDSSSSATVNGGTVHNGPGGVGRWLLLLEGGGTNIAQWGVVSDGTDQSTKLNAAFAWTDSVSGLGLTLYGLPRTYRADSTITIPVNSSKIDGQGMVIDSYVSGVAVDYTLISGTTYPVEGSLKRLDIRVNSGVSSTGLQVRASYSNFEDINVLLKSGATSAKGIALVGDEANGTGPYYNTFRRCNVQSQSSGTDHTGVLFSTAAPIYRAPNANTWIGGRIGQCLIGFQIAGNGNSFYNPTVENSPGAGTAFKFVGDTAGNCIQNNIISSYIENASVAFDFNANAGSNCIINPFTTGVITLKSDLNNTNVIIWSQTFNELRNGIKMNTLSSDAEVLDYYKEGTWTAVVSGGGTAGTYELQTNTCQYTRVGRMVSLQGRIKLAGAITGGGTSYLKITGLPFAKATDSNPMGALSTQGIDLDATTSSVAIGFEASGASSALIFYETVDNGTLINTPISAVSANDEIYFQITYFV